MAVTPTPEGPSPGQTCVLILIFTVLLQSLCVAVTYVYFTSELKQFAENECQTNIWITNMFNMAPTENAVETHLSEPRASGAEEQEPSAKALSPSRGT